MYKAFSRFLLFIFSPKEAVTILQYKNEPCCKKISLSFRYYMSLVMRKPAFCICENKDADQLRGNLEADQRLCFRYTNITIPLLPTSKISSLLLSFLYSPVCVGSGRKPRRLVFSQQGSIISCFQSIHYQACIRLISELCPERTCFFLHMRTTKLQISC